MNFDLSEDGIFLRLNEFSEQLTKMVSEDDKIEIFVKFNDFLKKNKEIVREKHLNLLFSVLKPL